MDTAKAFALGQANVDKERMVFDWKRAAERIMRSECREASAGLRSDWEWTGGSIYGEGGPVTDDYTFLASTWAVPELKLDGVIEDCYIMESETDWDSGTKWPPEALKILGLE